MHVMNVPGVHMKQQHSLHKRAIKSVMAIPNMDYIKMYCALKLLPQGKYITQTMCSNAEGCSRQIPLHLR